jgi:nitrous oxidase accessory protein NosD
VFEDVTITNADSILRLGLTNVEDFASCPEPLYMRRVSATNLSQRGILVAPFTGEPTGVMHLIDSDIGMGIQQHALRVERMNVVLDGVSISNADKVVDFSGATTARTLTVRNSVIEGFSVLHDDPSSGLNVNVLLEDSVFRNATELVVTGETDTTVTNCRIEAIADPFIIYFANPNPTFLTINGSSIDGADTGLFFDNVNPQAFITVTGNNFTNNTEAVRVDSAVNNSISMDFTNNYWGVATRAEIEGVIVDQNTDVDPNDDIDGLVNYASYATSPLSLPNLP